MKAVRITTALVLASAFAASPALAQNAVDYSTLTTAVNWDSVQTAMLAVGAIVIGILVVRKGIRFVQGMIK